MKKILTFPILFVFCLTLFLGGFFINISSTFAEDETPATEIIISSASGENGLADFINSYSETSQNAHIVLTKDINMRDITLTKTLGTQETPFKGTFDGRGFKISNLKFNFNPTTAEGTADDGTTENPTPQPVTNTKYAGLFGVTDGATIKNLSLEGNVDITLGEHISAYAGGLVGFAKNTNFSCVQANAKINCTNIGDGNLEMGALAGCAVSNCRIENVIARNSNGFGKLQLGASTKTLSFGGLVGRLSSSKILFAVVEANFDAEVLSSFTGELNLGGIAGRVEQVNSQIFNVACENNFTLQNASEADVNVGEVAGAIKNPAPASANIANIKFKNNNVARFGKMGSYVYQNSDLFDMILPADGLNDLEINENLDKGDLPLFFNNTNDWHSLYGNWDFADVWYVDSRAIYLQAFNKNFTLAFAENDILEQVTALQDSYVYDDSVSFEFAFKDGLNKYYNLTAVTLMNKYNSTLTTEISKTETVDKDTQEVKENYSILSSDYFAIESKKVTYKDNPDVDGIVLTIKKVCLSSVGQFSFNYQAKEFDMKISTELYDADGENLLDGNPGFVYFSGNSSTSTTVIDTKEGAFQDSKPYYGRSYRIETRVNPLNTANRFVGWFVKNGETLVKVKSESVIEFTFGQKYNSEDFFLSDFDLVAKYVNDACLVSVTLDEGISKIEFGSGEVGVVTENTVPGKEIAVSKTESNLKLVIFIKKGYIFDEETFIKDSTIFKAGDSDINIFKSSEKKMTEDGGMSYAYQLDMTKLTSDNLDKFSIKTKTTVDKSGKTALLWWIIGGSCGGVVLILIIVLIIVFARRNRFGGGGNASFSKKKIKNMYF